MRLALDQIRKDKRKAAVIMVSLAAGMAVFIAAVCAGIPVIAGAGMVHKGSVVERVRGV